MARPAKYTEDQILDAAVRLVADRGPAAATVGAIAEALEAPVGSIYHRFASRDLLLARLWLRTVKRFQHGFLEALSGDDLDDAALNAALHCTKWVRGHRDEARVLLLYRHRDLLAGDWPEDLADDLAQLNADVDAAMRRHARRRFGRADARAMSRLTFALVDIPYAAIRRHLAAGKTPPPGADGLVTEAVKALLTAPQA
jgi:AcrR family transcriptional regulator